MAEALAARRRHLLSANCSEAGTTTLDKR